MADVSGFLMKGVIVVLVGLLLTAAIAGAIYKYRYDKQISDLQNTAASQAQTIEVQKGVYSKLVITAKNLEDQLNDKTAENIALKEEIKKKDQEILSLTTVAVNWKKAYEAEVKAHQSDIEENGQIRTKVEFEKDFGYIGIKGYTLTNPPIAFVHIQQNRSLKLSVAISQDKDKVWHSYVTSSEDNVSADIELTGVNPYMLDPKWYEYIGVNAIAAIGSTSSGVGGLAGIGLSYKIGRFEVGPMVFVGISDRIDKYIGASFTWHPFAQ